MLSAVYIKGFKTFARPVRMPLGRGVSAIVGPNGSGKSNITDAVLFALGEGSPGLLRAGSMGDLIFSGSDSLPAANAAEVTLVLDNTEGRISLPYEEVSLTRGISRDGETEYGINGVRARLADVRAVAGEAGVGRHSILRQGAVDAIVAGGAAACRTALEEAAGLGVFRRRRLAASRKLEKAAARLESSRQLEAELSAQLQRIEAEAAAAREYRELEARYRKLSLAHLYHIATRKLDEGRERLAQLEARVNVLRARQEALSEEGRRLEAEEKELEGRLSITEQVLQELELGSEALRAEALRAERASLRPMVARDSRVDRSWLVTRLEAELDEITSQTRRLEEEVGGLEEEHSRKKEAFSRLEERVARGRAEHAEASGRRTRLAGELEALQEKHERVAGQLEEPGALGEEELIRLGEIREELASRAPDGLRALPKAVLGRLEELRLLAAQKEAEANWRRGVLVGRTEAEVRASRTPGRGAAGSKRLYEILRPSPGYEAALENLADGVLANTLDEVISTLDELVRFLSGEEPAERLEGAKNGTPSGKPLLNRIEILDASYADALERLLGGAYTLERNDHEVPKSGYDIAVTREGLRFTRTSASREVPDGDSACQVRLTKEEGRLDALKNRLGEELYDLQEAVSSASRRLDERAAEVEALADSTSRATRVARLLASEAARRARRAETTRERRSTDEAKLRELGVRISATEHELREARHAEERIKEELDAALSAVEPAYAAAREAAGKLARARTEQQNARERQARLSRGLTGLRNATTKETNAHLTDRAARCARSLDAAARERLARLRGSRSETAGIQAQTGAKHLELAKASGDVASELAGAGSEAAALTSELSRTEEAARAAEADILDEWGATLDIAQKAADSLPETDERERSRLARKLKSFGDVNLLAMGQEGQLRERHEFVTAQRSDAEAAAAEIKRIIQSVDWEIESRFQEIFREVRRAFGEMVPRMMEGAEGELSLSEDGVEIGLKLRDRGWKPLRVLSGGERSLLALAFLFSVFLGRSFDGTEGTFCMLDEAEAALDDINLARFLAVVDSYRTNGQFLLVTHQKRTMSAADVLYGITQDATGATVVVSKRLTGEKG